MRSQKTVHEVTIFALKGNNQPRMIDSCFSLRIDELYSRRQLLN